MSTYLELCRKVHGILRIDNETPGTQPTTVVGQSGPLFEITQWVNNAHSDICRMRTEWAFMRGSVELSLATGTRAISKAAMLAAESTFSKVSPFVTNNVAFLGISPTIFGAAEEVVEYVPYQHWQGSYDAPPIPVAQPRYFTILPDQSLEFESTADRDYTVRCNYRKKVVPLAADGDVPMFDEDYHNVLVWYAIVHYYCPSRDKTVELRNKADIELRRELTKLFNEQLPDFTIA